MIWLHLGGLAARDLSARELTPEGSTPFGQPSGCPPKLRHFPLKLRRPATGRMVPACHEDAHGPPGLGNPEPAWHPDPIPGISPAARHGQAGVPCP